MNPLKARRPDTRDTPSTDVADATIESDINEPVEAADSTNATDKPESVPQS